MLDFNPQVFVVQIVTFAIGMGAIWALYLKPLGKHLRERREGIAKDLDSASAARAESDSLRAELKAERMRIADENRKLIEKSKVDAEAFRAELMAKAKSEHGALLKAGRAQIEAERADAVRKIREASAALIVEATEKLLEKNLNKTTQTALAAKFVKAIKVSKN